MSLLSETRLHESRGDTSPRSGVVERVTLVMDVFGPHRQSACLEDVTECTGLPRSTAFRILRRLVDLGWLDHGSDGYQLGGRLQQLHGCAADYLDVRAAASELLTELNLKTGAVCHLGVLESSYVLYLDKVGGTVTHSVPSRVGARLCAEGTVSGRALLASLAPEEVDRRYAADRRLVTSNGAGIEQLHRRLDRVRRARGLAYSYAERCEMGISSLAAPVVGPHGAVAAVSVASRRTMQLEALGPVVAAAARRVSDRLFPEWGSRRSSLTAQRH